MSIQSSNGPTCVVELTLIHTQSTHTTRPYCHTPCVAIFDTDNVHLLTSLNLKITRKQEKKDLVNDSLRRVKPKKEFTYAQVLIDVKLAKELVTDVPIKLPNLKVRQYVLIYEQLPKFCTLCYVLGHFNASCKGKGVAQAYCSNQQPGMKQWKQGSVRVGKVSKEQPRKSDLGKQQERPFRTESGLIQGQGKKLITGTISEGIGGQISEHTTSLNQRFKEQQNGQNSGMIQTYTAGAMGTDIGLNQGQKIPEDSGTVQGIQSGQTASKTLNKGTDSGVMAGSFPGRMQEQGPSLLSLRGKYKATYRRSSVLQAPKRKVYFGADSTGKVQEIQPARTGQNQVVLPAPTTPTIGHLYSLRADRGNIKSITPTEMGDFMANGWQANTKFLPMGCLSDQSRKLKLLNTSLKALNKKHFCHISTKVDLAREELKMAQSSLHDNPQDTTPREVVRDLQQKTIRLCEAERKFYTQKAKCNFLLQVWDFQVKKDFPPLVKRIISIREDLKLRAPFQIPLVVYLLGILEVLYTHHLLMISSGPWDRKRSGIKNKVIFELYDPNCMHIVNKIKTQCHGYNRACYIYYDYFVPCGLRVCQRVCT
ncbi:hypothetical protein M9H77_12821 [Catharanthus roseus]|uniref:Uncharacterized protein n=1 Tax=Catharanthus roseus TaxID=4058 RepID=A0ACC0BIH8_CATRO|nr:hypothetical protein M9H77_12821 [Catharanthus roseus]